MVHTFHRCYARWVRHHTRYFEPREWFLLFPEHGLAVELSDGCAGSWHGAKLAHCTSVAVGGHPEDCLLSLFCGMRTDYLACQRRRQSLLLAMRARAAQPVLRTRAFAAGDMVWVRYGCMGQPVAGSMWRRTTACIIRMHEDGGADVAWVAEANTEERLEAVVVRERMVHAGVLGPRPAETGAALVGHRLWVYWPYKSPRGGRGEDEVFAGVVVEWDAARGECGLHLVRYDDGVELWEELGGPLAPEYCVHWQ